MTKNILPIHTKKSPWLAVGSMALCVALLITAEFMPVSLLTPIAHDLKATAGAAGQAISISGLFAVGTSLFIALIVSRFDRRQVLLWLTIIMLASLALIAAAPNFVVLMIARALLGVVIGGFWSLATAIVMRLTAEESVVKALGIVYMGNAVATAFAAPLGSYLGGMIGWRGVFWALTPLVLINLLWQWVCLPPMPPQTINRSNSVFSLLKQRHIAFAMAGVMLTFAGAFACFTYLRPFLENYLQVNSRQLSLLLLGLGMAGFLGTYVASSQAKRHLYRLLWILPLLLSGVTLALLALRTHMAGVALTMILWGAVNSAIPVCWSTWLSVGIREEAESGGGLMVGAIQLSIMCGASLGGFLLDRFGVAAALVGGVALLIASVLVVGDGRRLRPVKFASLTNGRSHELEGTVTHKAEEAVW